MIAYILRSLAQAVVVMLAVALIAFSMFRFVGDPVANMVGQEASVAERAELAERLGLNDPVPVQFGRFVLDIARGEFGMSYRQGRPVIDLLRGAAAGDRRARGAVGAASRCVFGIALGVYAAINRRGLLANAVMSLSLIGVSLPTFLIGIGLIYLFAVELRWLPSFGRGEVVQLRLVVDRAAHRERAQVADHAGADARLLPAHPDHAAGARRDARGAAHRLRQVRPRARHPRALRSASATRCATP